MRHRAMHVPARTRIDVHTANFAPYSSALPFDVGEGCIGFYSGRDAVWLSMPDGAPREKPASYRRIATAWRPGLFGNEAPESIDPTVDAGGPLQNVVRAQRVGDAVIVEEMRGHRDVRSIAWARGGRTWRVRDRVPDGTRVEVLGDSALLLDPIEKRLEILRHDQDDVLAIPLPEPLASAASKGGGMYRDLFVLPELDVVVLATNKVYWWRASALRSVVPGPVEWSFDLVWPHAQHDARATGEVTVAAYGRTFVRLNDGKSLTFYLSGPEKGEPVTLVGKLFEANGVAGWAWLERSNGERISLAPPSGLPVSASTEALRTRVPLVDRIDPRHVAELVTRLQKDGFLREATPRMIGQWSEDRVVAAEDLFADYYSDERRAASEGFLTHDWRFGHETDDIIAELSARIGGEPLFEQIRVEEEFIDVRDRAGVEHTIRVEGLDDVVEFFNEALARVGDPRRFHPYDHRGDQLTYVLATPEVAERLERSGVPLGTSSREDEDDD